MLVINWMSTRLVSIDPDESMSQAIRLLKENHIGRLPVIDKAGKLLGIVSDKDLKRAGASDATALEVHELAYLLSRVKVKDIMTPRPKTVHMYDTIEEAALVMLENKISGVPVLDDGGAVLAMLTQSDIFRALIALTGVTRGGVQFALDLPDEAGSIKAAADVVREYGGRMVSILSSYDRVAEGRRRVYFRMKNIDRSKLLQIKDELSHVGVLLYIIDTREHTKELLALGRLTGQELKG
ncbi:MAG: CBS and ACT domain-containing protein [Pseudomonadota bacterium]